MEGPAFSWLALTFTGQQVWAERALALVEDFIPRCCLYARARECADGSHLPLLRLPWQEIEDQMLFLVDEA